MKTPTISVIVPIYNVEDYLPTCLKSIAAQTFKDIEVILVDDGSTDKSGKICDEFCKNDTRFVVVHQNNQGVSTARNTGLDKAKGNYILMIDPDDTMHPQMIEILYHLIKSGDYDFSMCYGLGVYDMKSIPVEEDKDLIGKTGLVELSSEDCIQNLFSKKRKCLQYKVVWNKLYKRSLLIDNYFMKFPAQDVAQDLEFNTRICLRLRKAILLPKNLYWYYQRPMSLSRQGMSYRWVNAMNTYLYCVNEIPVNQKQLRAYGLRHLYKSMNDRVYWSKGTPFHQNAIDIAKSIRKQTIAEYLKNPYIPILEKFAYTTFYYIRFSYTIYLKIASFMISIRA